MKFRVFTYILLTAIVLAMFLGCGSGTGRQLAIAEGVVNEHPDSAYAIVRSIDYNDLKEDSLKAKYILIRAQANANMGRSLITDTLLSEAASYFLNSDDTIRWALASQLLSGHDFFKGNPDATIRQLEGIIPRINNQKILWDIHMNLWETSLLYSNYESAYRHADWLLGHTDEPEQIWKFLITKAGVFYYQGIPSKGVALCDSIIGTDLLTKVNKEASDEFYHEYSEILDGAGQSAKAIAIIDSLYRGTPATNSVDSVYMLMTLARYNVNAGNTAEGKRLNDAINLKNTRSVFEVYISVAMLKAAIQYKETGKFPSVLMHEISKNLQNTYILALYDRQAAMESVMELSEDKYEYRLQKQRLWLIISGVSLLLVVMCVAVYFIFSFRQKRLVESEERVETLERMLKEVETADKTDSISDSEKLKAALLKQLGIFKTFAGTPTPQNRDALKKISSLGHDGTTIESLVDWPEFFSMIDNLYNGFHSKLLARYPESFNDKEQQIIVLLKAGFSTKEISVLTEQSSATIYTRKSVIRKKVGTPENGDLVASIDEIIKGL